MSESDRSAASPTEEPAEPTAADLFPDDRADTADDRPRDLFDGGAVWETEADTSPRRRGRALVRLLATLVVLAVLVGAGIYALGRFVSPIGRDDATVADYAGPGDRPIEVKIADGADAASMARTLRAADVVASTQAFVDIARYDPNFQKIWPGTYRLSTHMSARQAFDALLDRTHRTVTRLTITEGETVKEVLTALSERTGVPVSTYEDLVRRPDGRLTLPGYAGGLVEGYLFPSTYDLDPAATPAQTLQMFIDEYTQQASALHLEQSAAAVGMTPAKIVTIASILEKEVRFVDEYPKASRVIYNRLANPKDFPTLGMDSTTRYALQNYEGPLTRSQLDASNPYNTRAVPGLPPGAISNPGTQALTAALSPAPGTWNYFVAMPDTGRTEFVTTSEEWDTLYAGYLARGGTAGG